MWPHQTRSTAHTIIAVVLKCAGVLGSAKFQRAFIYVKAGKILMCRVFPWNARGTPGKTPATRSLAVGLASIKNARKMCSDLGALPQHIEILGFVIYNSGGVALCLGTFKVQLL